MRGWLSALAGLMVLNAVPALAAPCTTSGTASAPIAFPKHDASDIGFARAMVPVIFPQVSGGLPRTLTCTRTTVRTALGDYVLGGENGEFYPRMAMRADGKAGPVVYLAASPAVPDTFALVVRRKGSPTVVKAFYAGIPTDARLGEDVRAALADDGGIMAFDDAQNTVRYGFAPAGGVPPPVQSGTVGEGVTVTAGPQILVAGSGDPATLDGTRHKPSGFTCPQTFDGLAVLLMSIDPRKDSLTCQYRAGTDLRYREDDPIRYQISLVRASHGETARGPFDALNAEGRKTLHITGDHAPPLAAGPAPAPEFVAYWDTADAGVQGFWVGKAGRWIVYVRAQYPASAANDAEAGKVAGTLFADAGKQVK
jgi:hypothetical protein